MHIQEWKLYGQRPRTSQQWMIWCILFVYLWFCCMNIAPRRCYISWISGPSALGKFRQNYEVIVAINFVSPCTAHSIGQQLMIAYINYILHHIHNFILLFLLRCFYNWSISGPSLMGEVLPSSAKSRSVTVTKFTQSMHNFVRDKS